MRLGAADPDPAELLRLGRAHLTGRGGRPRPDLGLELITRAADLSYPEAVLQLGVLAAAGIARSQDWTDALDYLQRAAELGLKTAQEQLIILSEPKDGARAASAAWSDLRRDIDLQRLLAPGIKQSLCEKPRIRVIERLIPASICRWLIGRAAPGLFRATLFNPESRRPEINADRSNSAFVFDLASSDIITAIVRARIASALQRPTFCLEPTQVFHYSVGQNIGLHFDFLEGRNLVDYRDGTPYLGQRVATCLVYLNEDFEGGQTFFPTPDIKFKGKIGDAIYFANVDLDGEPDRSSQHAGLPPTSGEKWIISQWAHDRAFTGVAQES